MRWPVHSSGKSVSTVANRLAPSRKQESDRTEYIADKRRSYILILVGLSIVAGLRHAIKLTDDNGIYLVKHIVDNTRNDQVGTISEKLPQRSHAKYPSGTPVVKHPEKQP